MIGRADIEESKSNVAMNAWLPQASYPCGNFSDTSSFTTRRTKGSVGHASAVRVLTWDPYQISFYPYTPPEVSVLGELIVGHPRCLLTDVPPQPNSPASGVPRVQVYHPSPVCEGWYAVIRVYGCHGGDARHPSRACGSGVREAILRVVVFQYRVTLPPMLHLLRRRSAPE